MSGKSKSHLFPNGVRKKMGNKELAQIIEKER